MCMTKVEKDSYYKDAAHVFGYDILPEAGFFEDDNLSDTSLVEQYANAGIVYGNWQKMYHNYLQNTDKEKLAILVSTGSFNPVHQGHLHMMESAKECIQSQGWTVLGGFLSPSHDKYVHTKDTNFQTHGAKRCEMIAAATHDSHWLACDFWESLRVPYNINFTDVLEYFQHTITTTLSKLIKKGVTVFYVFGSDNAKFLYTFVNKGHAVCVVRPNSKNMENTADIVADVVDHNRDAASRLFMAHGIEASSTAIRKGNHELLPTVVHKIWEQTHHHDNARYLLRDDSIPACKHFIEHSCSLQEKLPVFITKLAHSLHHYIHIKNEIVIESVENQKHKIVHIVNKLEHDTGCINLDPWTRDKTTSAIDISRVFDICDAQTHSHGFIARPDSDELAVQVSRLDKECYVLVDDDIATGSTINFVTNLLQTKTIKDTYVLTSENFYDVVDVRDFIIGSNNGGLVVNMWGQYVRAPYIWPFVNLKTRANIAYQHIIAFSLEVLAYNIELFENTHITIHDCDDSFKKFALYSGFHEDMLLIDFCKQLYNIIAKSNYSDNSIG